MQGVPSTVKEQPGGFACTVTEMHGMKMKYVAGCDGLIALLKQNVPSQLNELVATGVHCARGNERSDDERITQFKSEVLMGLRPLKTRVAPDWLTLVNDGPVVAVKLAVSVIGSFMVTDAALVVPE